MPLWSESDDLYSFLLDLSVNGYDAKEIAIEAVANAQVWHRRLGHLRAQSPNILLKRDGTGITFKRDVLDFDVCTVGKAQQLSHPKRANHKVNRPFQLCYGNLMGPCTRVVIGSYKYVSKVTHKYAIYFRTN